MTSVYNAIAGRSGERLAALSDAVFAVAMTLLVLDIRPPALEHIHGDAELLRALGRLAPQLVAFLMSFMTLGIFWVGQQTQHAMLSRTDRSYTWIHIGFLMAVCLLPFSTDLLAEFIAFRAALLIYWANILALGVLLLAAWYRAKWSALVKPDAPPGLDNAFIRRILIAQGLYAFGAALCVFDTWWSIGFIVAVQLVYVIGPRFRPLSWL
ncbi:MAG TPA: TMEM175 family protein [Rhizomicrobium sp.]